MEGRGNGKGWRFWLPLWLLAALAAHSSQRLLRAHLSPEVDAINYTFEREVQAQRGSVFDRNGRCLVKSVPYWDYHLDPVAMTNRVVRENLRSPPRSRQAIAKTIARALELPYEKVLKMSADTTRLYQPLAMSADTRVHDILANSKIVAGVVIEDKHVRQYIHGRRLAHVLGSVNAEGVGSAGLEQRYERHLAGAPGRIRGMRDARGSELYDRRIVSIDPIPGADVYLTVDQTIQYEVECAMTDGIRQFGAAAGWCIVMDAKTGAVLAMTSQPDFHPMMYGRATDSARINRACAFTYEPGSVMKVITASAGVDLGLVTTESLYDTKRDDPRYYRLPGDGRHVWEPRMSVKDAIVHSSNIVIGKLGVDIGPERLWTYMRGFGFGAKTGVELPGEEAGILPHWRAWDKVKWSRAPIGQGVSVTSMQLVSAYQAIANDGRRMKPYIVDRVVASDGTRLYEGGGEMLGHPITRETARRIRTAMLGVASRDGTARRAAVSGYSVAGKTGTAQKVVNGRYSDNLFYATFCGMVPASDPALVILVTLDFAEPRKFHQGGNSSAPIFRRIATGALRYLMIQPDMPDEIEQQLDDDDEFDQIMNDRSEHLGM